MLANPGFQAHNMRKSNHDARLESSGLAEVEEGGRVDRFVLYRLIELQIKLPRHGVFTESQELYLDIGRTDHRHGVYCQPMAPDGSPSG